MRQPEQYATNVHQNQCKDGRLVWMSWSNKAIYDEQGGLLEMLAIGTDISQLKAAEEAQREADRAKDEFLSILSHELQTPVTSILGWAQLALKQQSPELNTRALEIVQRNARRQRVMVEELLDVSRLLNRKIELQMEVVDLRAEARQAVENLQVAAAERALTLTCAPGADDPLPVLGDPERLQQCLGNLLRNSLKFTPAGGQITVACTREDDQAVLRVHDTGRGLRPEALPAIFQLFRQVDRDERAGGLGLGLAVTRGLIDLHGGAITAASPGPGHGSTFTITLPLAE